MSYPFTGRTSLPSQPGFIISTETFADRQNALYGPAYSDSPAYKEWERQHAASGQKDWFHSRRVEAIHERYKEHVTCPICLELFVEPHILSPCGHTVCAPCFYYWEGAKLWMAPTQCPECKVKVEQVAHNLMVQDITNSIIHSSKNNHDEGWMRATDGRPMGKELEAYERRVGAWASIYEQLPKKTMQLTSRDAAQAPRPSYGDEPWFPGV